VGIEGVSPETVTLDAGEWRRYQEYVGGLEKQQTADGVELKRLRPLVERLEREEAERQRIADLPAVSRFSWSKIAMLSVAAALTVANIFLLVLFIRLAFITPFIWVFVALTAVSLVVAARAFLTRSLIAPLVFSVTVIVAFVVVNTMAAAMPVSDDQFSLSVSQADGQSSSEWAVVILDPTGSERFRQAVEAGTTHFEYPIAGLAEGETIVAQTTAPGTKCSLSLGRLTVAQTVYMDPGPLDCRYTVPVAPAAPVVEEAPAAVEEPAPAPPVEEVPVEAPAPAPPVEQPAPAQPAPQAPSEGVSYANCDAVRAAGAAPIRTGDPGWQQKFDRDGDGVGCE
jgi:hypothetical protein